MQMNSHNIHQKATWTKEGVTVAGGNSNGDELDQLHNPRDMFIDNNMTIYVADQLNNRIMKWKADASEGEVAAGGVEGSSELSTPWDVIIDEQGLASLSAI